MQGPRSNFKIKRGGGGGGISDSILEGAQDTFSYKLFKILKILGGGGASLKWNQPTAFKQMILMHDYTP